MDVEVDVVLETDEQVVVLVGIATGGPGGCPTFVTINVLGIAGSRHGD